MSAFNSVHTYKYGYFILGEVWENVYRVSATSLTGRTQRSQSCHRTDYFFAYINIFREKNKSHIIRRNSFDMYLCKFLCHHVLSLSNFLNPMVHSMPLFFVRGSRGGLTFSFHSPTPKDSFRCTSLQRLSSQPSKICGSPTEQDAVLSGTFALGYYLPAYGQIKRHVIGLSSLFSFV